eukprot:SAG31_NODE_37405_length_304_cov_1.121951_1_plen_30_part_10
MFALERSTQIQLAVVVKRVLGITAHQHDLA